MKIKSLNTGRDYEITITKQGENQQTCPECSALRKHPKAKSFSFNAEKGTGYCQNCLAKFVEYKPYVTDKVYSKPEFRNKTALIDAHLQFFTDRFISQDTLNKMQICTESGLICFPYYRDSQLVNIKYRALPKQFVLYKDAELIFYNLDAVSQFPVIVIVEGEMDALALIEAGIENVISVPNGANKNLQYLDSSIHLFEGKEVIIAVDNDSPGFELKQELIRRFGAENCSFVNWEQQKDANEYLILNGKDALRNKINTAEKVPIDGIVNFDKIYSSIYELYLYGLKPGKKINDDDFDKAITWETSRLAVWTGIPSHGKSEAVDYVNCKLNILHEWKMAYFSPENQPVQYHVSKIIEKLTGKKFNATSLSKDEFLSAYDYVKQNVFSIMPEKDFTYQSILNKASFLVKSQGIKILTIDPYNRLEHVRESGQTETDYISRFLDDLGNFAIKHDVLINLVAHPRKMEYEGSKFRIPNMYDINASANFYNKCDYGIIVYRVFTEDNPHVQFHIPKVKFKHLGDGGRVDKRYNYNNGRYENINIDINSWDNNNWLHREQHEMPVNEYEFNKNETVPF